MENTESLFDFVKQLRSPWTVALEQNDPALLDLVNDVREFAFGDGALAARHKLLMLMLAAAQANLIPGIGGLAKLARKAGASEEEIHETLQIATLMTGMPKLAISEGAYTP